MRKLAIVFSSLLVLVMAMGIGSAQAMDTVQILFVDFAGKDGKRDSYAYYGEYWGDGYNTAKMAVDEILQSSYWDQNLAVDLILLEMEEGNQDDYHEAGRYLLNCGTAGVILNVDDEAAKVITQYIGPANIPTMIVVNTDPWFTSQGWTNVWNVGLNDMLEKMQMAAFMLKGLGLTSTYTVCMDDESCIRADRFAAWVQYFGGTDLGQTRLGDDQYSPGSFRDNEALDEAAGAQADVVYVAGHYRLPANVLRTLRYIYKADRSVVFAESYACGLFFHNVPKTVPPLDGAYCPYELYTQSQAWRGFNKSFKEYSAKYEVQPKYAMIYDATRALLSAMAVGGGTDPESVRKGMLQMDFSGIAKRIVFDESGNTPPGNVIMRTTEHGGLIPVYDPDNNIWAQ